MFAGLYKWFVAGFQGSNSCVNVYLLYSVIGDM